MRVLFVNVDPNRDSLPVLKQYVALFGPQMVGLRGTPDELASLARRYRVAYSVTPAQDGHPYQVTHSSIVYVFDQDGNVRLLFQIRADAQDGPHPSQTDDERQDAMLRIIQPIAGDVELDHYEPVYDASHRVVAYNVWVVR